MASKPTDKRNPNIDHPQHYGGEDNPYEAIKVMGAWLGNDAVVDFCLCNSIKYISRAGKKGGLETFVEDLEKAVWYLRYAVGLTKQPKWPKRYIRYEENEEE